MKTILETIIRRRNPNFKFDEAVSNAVLIQFIWIQAMSMIRGMRLVLFFKNPKGAMIGKRVSFFHPRAITFGKFLKLGNDVSISGLGTDGVTFGNNVGIGAHSRIIVSTSLNDIGKHIRIGNNVGIGEFAYLGGAGGLEIGNDCIVGQYFSCHPENHRFADAHILIRHQGVTRKGIKVGNNCWIGSKVTILDGVTIGDNCVIAAGSVVNKDMPAHSIIGGVPAKILKSNAPVFDSTNA